MFTKILIANRGEIACRVIRTLKDMNIASVAVYSDADENAAHVMMADEAVRIGPAPASESYLNADAILGAAKSAGAQAIHPGYGFMSENASFAKQCEANGIAFIGPTPEQMIEFGLKHRARELAEKFGVPLVPGSGLLNSEHEAVVESERIGYPVMLKSTAGGGGIGMSICRNSNEVKEAFERIGRLSRNNFKDSGLFVEKYIEHSRHIEVQIFGTGKGDIAILGERDCSTQRRNQKVVEETPAPKLDASTRKALHAAARRLAEGVNYRSAGTVEFIYDKTENKFYFLEVNTRLQVEHGITEEVFGLDLVRWMIEIAAGLAPFKSSDVFEPKGAAMEFRIYAEDPGKDFRPSSGVVTAAEFPKNVRCDKWIQAGTEVSAYYDPLLAKVIVKGESRNEVIRKSIRALENCVVAGLETNLILLRAVLGIEKFRSGDVSTSLLKNFEYRAPTFEILAAGAQTTVQDFPGRLGYWDVGVPPSGPMDDYSFRLANRIVGNAENAPALEMTLMGASLRFNTDAVIAVCGGEFPAKLNNQPMELDRPVGIKRGDTVKIGSSKRGQRCYLAVRGGIDVPEYLGSRSTFTLGKFGGHGGRALAAGDVLHIGNFQKYDPVVPSKESLPEISNNWKICVLYGPQGAPDYLTPEDIEEFFAAEWEVHYNSSRTGVRLIGPKPKWARPDGGDAGLHPSNLHDNAYAIGTVDFTGDMPVILGHDGPSLGGFVCPATIISGDLWKIGQLRSGDKIHFIPVDRKYAAELRAYNKKVLESPNRHGLKRPKFEVNAPISPILEEFVGDDEMGNIVFRQDGDENILIEFGPPIIDLRLRFKAHAWMLEITDMKPDGIIDLTPGIRSIQIHHDPDVLPVEKLLDICREISAKLKKGGITEVPSRTVHLPLSWDDPSTRLAIEKYVGTVRPGAPWCCPNNIEFIKRINGLKSIDEVYDIVFKAEYLVMGLGDVYLGAPVATPLDPRMRLVTTKYNPARTWTPENAVGIGGAYMCVYGMEGPGGYQFVGRTSQMWNRFNITKEFKSGKPYLLRFFDKIKFYPVGAEELLEFRKKLPYGKVGIKIEEGVFDINEYEKFLRENAESISSFESMRHRAFEDEKQRWIENGQLTFKSGLSEGAHDGDENALEDGEEGIYSPVSGGIWKLNVSEPGTSVKEGDTLAVLESMKMEISITAESDCVITKIFCGNSGEVKSGQCLFAAKI